MGLHTNNAQAFMLQTYQDLHAILSTRAEDVQAFARDSENVDWDTFINLVRLQNAVSARNEEEA